MSHVPLESWKHIAQTVGLVLSGPGAVLGLLAWWTTWKTQAREHTKVVLDALQTAIEKNAADVKHQKFLQDMHKECLAGLIFGCQVRSGDLGRLMEYHARGFATTREIGAAWPHRNSSQGPLTFRPNGWERALIAFALTYAAACGLFSIFFTVVAFCAAAKVSGEIAPYALALLFLAAVTLTSFRTHLLAALLSARERRHQAATTEVMTKTQRINRPGVSRPATRGLGPDRRAISRHVASRRTASASRWPSWAWQPAKV